MANRKIVSMQLDSIDLDRIIGLIIGAGMLGLALGNWIGVIVLMLIAVAFCFKEHYRNYRN